MSDIKLEGGSCITYEATHEEQPWEQGCTGELGFDPVELWVMGPPCGLKARRHYILHGHDSKAG